MKITDIKLNPDNPMADDNTKGNVTDFSGMTKNKSVLSGKKHDTRWKKGQSGNPNGRPVGSVSIVEGIKRKLLEIEPENKKTYLDLFLSRYFRKAIKDGDVGLIRDMINRIDGMPKQSVDMTSLGDKITSPIPYLPKKDNE